jgi:hypothetical protein
MPTFMSMMTMMSIELIKENKVGIIFQFQTNLVLEIHIIFKT